MGNVNLLLPDFYSLGKGDASDLMERISQDYFRKLDQKEGLRKRLARKARQVASRMNVEVIGDE